jgi:hypothetical protein
MIVFHYNVFLLPFRYLIEKNLIVIVNLMGQSQEKVCEIMT